MEINFKVRASSAGKLMTNPKKKDEKLSQTTKTYIQEYVKEIIYGYRKEIKSKYISKGNAVEDDAIAYLIEKKPELPFMLKNETKFEDDYFTGTPDIMSDEMIIDIKSSWDAYTFPLFEDEIPTDDYFYQLQVYMHLTGKRKALLAYVLMDTPAELIYEEIVSYEFVDSKFRIKEYFIDYDENIINDLKERIKNCREYIKTLNV